MTDDRMEVVQRLADVLAKENDALKHLDFAAAVALIPAKEAALDELTGPASRPLVLSAPVQRLVDLASENQLLLERAIAVQTRVIRIVARACAPLPAATRYNGHDGRTRSARTAALALSTRV